MGLQDYYFGKSAEPAAVADTPARKATITPAPPTDVVGAEILRNRSLSFAFPKLNGTIQQEMVVAYLYQQQCSRFWITSPNSVVEGAFMRAGWEGFVTCPPVLSQSPLADACLALNAQIVITLKSKIVEAFFKLQNDTGRVRLRSGLEIQMLDSIWELNEAQKYQCAAFVREGSFILVWDSDPNNIILRAADLETQLVEISWRDATGVYPVGNSRRPSIMPDKELLLESGGYEQRPENYLSSIMSACTVMLVLLSIGLGWRQLAQEITIDGNYIRLSLLAMAPVQFFMSLFFGQVIIICVFQLLGPIGQCAANSAYYSGASPSRLRHGEFTLPHVTIQCPVYTEGLQAVVEPTVLSLKAAMATYEMQGGTANIFVNDDGMQANMSPEDIKIRKEFYKTHGIGWVARPKHNSTYKTEAGGEGTYVRHGRFKKASNMNYALMISSQVEEKLADVVRNVDWTQDEENVEYTRCLQEVLSEHEEGPCAEGNIRMGDYVLIVDSDTRIPADCLLDAVSELEQSPEVGILQFTAGVLHVTDDFFEKGISFFTDLIYTAIGYMVANGDVAPFVGHNAILRWTAMQDVAFTDDNDPWQKFWSECSVSEDFDMSLRMQAESWTVRFATYTGEGFKEGVSLTVYDELARWEKYAYGCSEMIFHPIKDWPWKGPFTKLIRNFLWSDISLTGKLATMGYIGTYYAIGASWVLSLLNYFLVGWENGVLDTWYIHSFDVFFGLIFIFSAVCNIALAVLRYRTHSRTFFGSLLENFQWIFLFAIFFGGLSLSVSQAIICHLFSINIQWSTTEKEAKDSNFFQEIPKLIARFKYRFVYCLSCIALILVCAFAVPYQWQIVEFTAIFPLAMVAGSHLLLPIALNPALMRFTW